MLATHYFDANHTSLLYTGLFLIAASCCTYEWLQKKKLSLFLLFAAGVFLCSFAALLDPFLNTWDEQFHALVAKNLLKHPLTPTLYDTPVLPYNPDMWISNHVWLHKQPLFLWQIALSLKLFGFNTFAVRLPSVLMMSLAPLMVYRIGRHSLNERIAYYGALLFCTSYFVHELLTGFLPSDHNDVVFLFYILAGIWTWVEYEHSQKAYWLVLTGIFSGAAVLVKWLTGLLVFSGWGLSILLTKEKRTTFGSYKAIALSVLVCVLVVIPWQLYISYRFPVESAYEYNYNTKHFSEVVENHSGDRLYYYYNLMKIYSEGDLIPFVIFAALVLMFRKLRSNTFRIAFFSEIVLVYTFFTLAATKMTGFCFIVSPFIFLALATLIHDVTEFLKARVIKKKMPQQACTTLLLLLIAWGNLNLYRIAYRHTLNINPGDTDKRILKIYDAAFIRSLPGYLPSGDYVLFGCKAQANIATMFYTNVIAAYHEPLTPECYQQLKAKQLKMAVIDNGRLEKCVLDDPAVIKIKAPDPTWK